MDLIDRDELELDTEWSDYYDEYMSYSQSQINGAVEVQAIPLDKVKQARESVQKYMDVCDEDSVAGINMKSGLAFALEILDKLIAESEE